ncbi:shikimate kinase, chloroplastic [Punica granatum]|uniref:shikimate kinase n=2 Tax=Punica granatum TaxID=22663 RepID=A0A6P8DWE0_PUNGR|nr:shikimate kinase, chloroplastic [Punica granatum]
MEVKVVQRPQISMWIEMDKIGRKPSGSLRFDPHRARGQQRVQVLISARLQPARVSNKQRASALEASYNSYKNFPASILESESINGPYDESVILKNKSQEIEPYLSGRCIYLVGMMGSGKTTVGKVLSQVLGYSFCDSDSLIEEEVNGTPVSDIFQLYGEGFFRDKETEILRKLSIMHRIVVSTGGGAVMRPINWKHMQNGISVWLDVPLEALAQRISAVGTKSRPLLHSDSSDAYRNTYKRLSNLFEERSEAYANANARVSLENIAVKLGYRDVSTLTPTAIAIEALDQIENYLKDEEGMSFGTF